ncbi:hypothetical protein SNEBB_005663 [Seison nebaliae]|nr:hypothetical protein SNEBB_005663 [Seison nebaliae]
MEVVLENHENPERYDISEENDIESKNMENSESIAISDDDFDSSIINQEFKKFGHQLFRLNKRDFPDSIFRPIHSDVQSSCSFVSHDSFSSKILEPSELRRSFSNIQNIIKRTDTPTFKSDNVRASPIPRSYTTGNVSSDMNSSNNSRKLRRFFSLITSPEETNTNNKKKKKKKKLKKKESIQPPDRRRRGFDGNLLEIDRYQNYAPETSVHIPITSLRPSTGVLLTMTPPKKRKSRWYSCLFWCCIRQKPSSSTDQPFSQYIADNITIEGLEPSLVKKLQNLQHREIYPSDYDTLLQLYEATVKAKCCDDDFIQHIPVVQLNGTEIEKNPTCAICLYELTSEDFCKRLLCSHVFHSKCIDECLRTRTTCPIRNCEIMFKDE